MLRALVLSSALVLVSSLSINSVQANPLRGAQIEALFPGNFLAVWKEKVDVDVDVKLGGDLTAKYGIFPLSGSWKVVGDKLCVTISFWIGSKKRCGFVRQRGEWYVGLFRANGTPRVRFRKQ